MSPNSTTLEKRLPYIVALTGGIASGKTLISDEFAKLGVPIVDTDIISREIVEPGQPALKKIEQEFGADFIDRDGRLDRTSLRALIFSDPNARVKLESILHPRIREKVDKALAKLTTTYCILVIPLLTERNTYPYIDRILVIDVKPEIQIMRLMSRDRCNLEQAKQALAAQANRAQRLEIADDILSNDATPGAARIKVAALHKKYVQLSVQMLQKK